MTDLSNLELLVAEANPVPDPAITAVHLDTYRSLLAAIDERAEESERGVQPIPVTATTNAQRGLLTAAAAFAAVLVVGFAVMFLSRTGESEPAGPATTAPATPITESDAAPATAAPLLTLEGGMDSRSVVVWNPDGTSLATVIAGTANVWDAITGKPLAQQELDHIGDVSTLLWSPDGTRLAVDSEIYDPFTGDLLLGEIGDRVLAFSPDGSRIVAGGAWGWAAILDSVTGDEQLSLPLAPGPRSWVSAAAWSPDGTRVATTWGMDVKIWDTNTGDELLTLGAGIKVTDMAWSPDSTRVVTASDDGRSAEIWDTNTGEPLVPLTGHTGNVQAVAWSPDGTRIATASNDETATIWDATIGNALATLTGHTGPVTDVAWSPDGTRIATASNDWTIKIWNAEK